MSRTYVSNDLRRAVRERSGECCEYCLIPESIAFAKFEVDHVIAEKHGGKTTLDNLALACPLCNQRKGTDLTSIDPETSRVVMLFNPRTERWADHFGLHEGRLHGRTAVARVTIRLLNLNEPSLVQVRTMLADAGVQLPPTG